MSLNQLDPSVAQAESFIEKQKLPPDKAVDYLLSKGVDPKLASLVMKYRMLKQASNNQAKQQPQPKTVSQDIDDQINQRTQGVAGLPVPNSTFNMAGGGIVAFDGGGMATPTDPTDFANVQQQQLYQGIMDQQAAQNAGLIAQGMADGGDVETGEEDLQTQQAAIYQRQLKEWQRQNAQNYLAKGQKLGVPPAPQQNKKGGMIKHFVGGGPSLDLSDQPPVDPQDLHAQAQAIRDLFPDSLSKGWGGEPQDPKAAEDAAAKAAAIAAQRRGTIVRPGQPPPGGPQGQQSPPPAAPGPQGQPGPAAPAPNMQQTMLGRQDPSFLPQQPAQQPAGPPMGQGGGGAGRQPNVDVSASMRGPGDIPDANAMVRQQQAYMSQIDKDVNAAKPQSIEQNFQHLQGIADSQGVGAAAKQHIQFLDQLKTQLEDYKSKGNWMAIAQAGFAMAQAATQNPHGGFLGALAVGGEQGAKAYQQNIAQYRDLSFKINEQKYAVQQSQENLVQERSKEALDQHNKEVAHYESMVARKDAAELAAWSRTTSTDIAKISAAAMQRARISYNADAYFAQRFGETQPGTQEYNTLMQQYKDWQTMKPQVQGAEINADKAKAIQEQKNQLNPVYQAAQQQLIRAQQAVQNNPTDEKALTRLRAAQQLVNSTGVGTPQGPVIGPNGVAAGWGVEAWPGS